MINNFLKRTQISNPWFIICQYTKQDLIKIVKFIQFFLRIMKKAIFEVLIKIL